MDEKKASPHHHVERAGLTDERHSKTANPLLGWHSLGKQAAEREKAANAARKWGKRNG